MPIAVDVELDTANEAGGGRTEALNYASAFSH